MIVLKQVRKWFSSHLFRAAILKAAYFVVSRNKYFPCLDLNPFTLRAAKRGLTILEIFSLQKHFFENIWRRNVDHTINNNSP